VETATRVWIGSAGEWVPGEGVEEREVEQVLRESSRPRTRSVTRRVVPRAARRRIAAAALTSIGGVSTEERILALTIDDGPDAVATPLFLASLARHRMRATFFVLVDRAEANSDLIGHILAGGHEVGLHGGGHVDLPAAPLHEVVRCIAGGRRRLEGICGRSVRFFRPPFGHQDLRSYLVARACRLTPIAWSAQADDWLDMPPNTMVDRVWDGAGRGGIALLHDGLAPPPGDGRAQSSAEARADAFTMVLERMTVGGWTGVSIGGLLRRGPAVRFPWFEDGHRSPKENVGV
jgi:peptidoglycan-N-acetylglucosamine deacetylase